MAFANTGQLSLSSIAQAYGDSAPYSISERYGGSGLPSSGQFGMSSFYGKQPPPIRSFTYTSSTTHSIGSGTNMVRAWVVGGGGGGGNGRSNSGYGARGGGGCGGSVHLAGAGRGHPLDVGHPEFSDRGRRLAAVRHSDGVAAQGGRAPSRLTAGGSRLGCSWPSTATIRGA